MGVKAIARYSYADYLALEAESEVKHEFHDGYLVAMAGGTLTHGRITMNISRAMANAIDATNKGCEVLPSDVKVMIEHANRAFYPDASIVCGELEVSDRDPHAIINPILLVEVLSKNTAAFDRGAKFHHYRELDALREYLLISQEEYMVDTYYRTDNGTWEINTYLDPQAEIPLKSVGISLKMADVYRRVVFETESSE